MTLSNNLKKIAVYGVSSSGKSYLINKLSENNSIFYYCEGSKFLLETSNKNISSFSSLNNEEKNIYRKKFIEYADNIFKEINKHIVVDAHYSFYKNDNFEIARIKEDLDFYDIFLYLDTDANIIYDRSLKRDDCKRHNYSVENIEKLKQFEKYNLEKELKEIDKELIIINDDNIDNIIMFINEYINNPIFDVQNNINSILENNKEILSKYSNIILSDCDSTLSMKDTTIDLFEYLNIDFSYLKKIFKNNNYSSYSFYNFSNFISEINYEELKKAAENIHSRIELFTNLLDEIDNKKDDFLFIAITSGIKEIWEIILNKKSKFVIGGLHNNNCNYLVTKFFKYQLCKKLINMEKNVIALGDSLIDYDMLINANKGFIIANNKLSSSLKGIEISSNLNQLKYQKIKIQNLIERDSIYD